MTIRVAIVDDHAVVRAGLRTLLEEDQEIVVVGEYCTAEALLDALDTLSMDVVLMDVCLPGMDGIQAVRHVHAHDAAIAVVGMAVQDDAQQFFGMLTAGAAGYILKGLGTPDLLRAIRSAAVGEAYLEPRLARTLIDDYLARVVRCSQCEKSADPLTRREREVLFYLAEDWPVVKIAEQLDISAKTVDRHRDNIMRKLDLHSRIELVKYALRKGIISLDDEPMPIPS
ncbi:MAG: response regulator [Anaerolineales bacterium]